MILTKKKNLSGSGQQQKFYYTGVKYVGVLRVQCCTLDKQPSFSHTLCTFSDFPTDSVIALPSSNHTRSRTRIARSWKDKNSPAVNESGFRYSHKL